MELNKPRHFIGIIVWGYLMLMAAFSAAVFFYQEGPFWLRLLFAAICMPFGAAFGAMAEKCDKKIDFDELNIDWSLKVYKPISMTFLFISMAPGIGVLRVLSEDSIPDQRATPFMGAVAVFAFFSWLFGKMETTCNECNTQVRIKNATYCSKCGETLQRKTIDRPVCSKCNQPFKPNSIHCTKCGHKLVADQTANPPGHKAPPRSKATSSPCDVILQNPGKNKIQVIKEVRVFTGLGLKDAKKLVDTAPNTVLSNAPKSTAEIAKKALEAAGATVTFQKGYKAPPRSKATSFPCDVILQNPGKNKIQVIKEVGFFTGLGLKDAKNLVDTAPNTVLTNATKSAAEKAKKVLEAAGATVTFQNR